MEEKGDTQVSPFFVCLRHRKTFASGRSPYRADEMNIESEVIMSDANSSPPQVSANTNPDRRESQRESCERYAMVFPLNDATPERFQRACITTRSDNGVGITCGHEIAVGTKFILRYKEGRPEPKLYEVVQSRWVGGACHIGARLIRELAPAHSAAPPSAA